MSPLENLNRQRIIWVFGCTVILFLGAVLRIEGIDSRSLWFDESIEYWMAVVPLTHIHQAVAQATHDPPLYSYLLHGWLQWGIQGVWLRLPSLFASLLAVAGMLRLGRQVFNQQVGFLAGAFLAISAADVRYAQEVGQYSLMVCLVVWSLIFLLRAKAHNRWSDWIAWGAIGLISIYTHYGSAIVLLTCGGAVMLHLIGHKQWTAAYRQAAVGAGVGVGLLPLVLIIIPQQLGRLGASRLPLDLGLFWQQSAQILTFPLVGNEGIMFWPWTAVSPTFIWLPLLFLLLAALFKTRKISDPMALLIISWVGYYLISRTGSYFFAPTRHSLLLLPLIGLNAALGAHFLNRKVRHAGSLLFVILALVSIFFPREGQEDIRAATAYWLAQHQAGQPTYVYYGASVGFRYQLDVQTTPHSGLPPFWYGECLGAGTAVYCHEHDIHYGQWIRGASSVEMRQSVRQAVGEADTAWLIFSHVHEDEAEQMLEALQTDYDVVQAEIFEGAAVYKLQSGQ